VTDQGLLLSALHHARGREGIGRVAMRGKG
jgi:hypothetical protein